MDQYLDVKLRRNPEISTHYILGAIYFRFHQALVAIGHGRIGVSFPDFQEKRRSLGQCLRLHGSSRDLDVLMANNWLVGMFDYVEVGPRLRVPEAVQYRTVRRVQTDSSPERLRRRLIRRHQLDEMTALERIPDSVSSHLSMPWIEIYSNSTGQRFRMFIDHGPLLGAATFGHFSSYGLSSTTTVPWF